MPYLLNLIRIKVVLTDYPDAPLVENMSYNAKQNLSEEERERVAVKVSSGILPPDQPPKFSRATYGALRWHRC